MPAGGLNPIERWPVYRTTLVSLDFIFLFFGGAEVSHGNSGSEFRAAEKQKNKG